MKTYLSLEYDHREALPDAIDEIRSPDALVEHFLMEYSEPGDKVIDIFAGFGTTLTVAERLDRVPVGIEYEPDRVTHIRDRVSRDRYVRQGDVRELDLSWVPTCECCFTSPPFMERTDDRNPFENYTGRGSYAAYLDDIETPFRRLKPVMRSGGRIVVDIVNIKHAGRVTPLAWDVAQRIANVFRFDGETVITWKGEGSSDAGDGRYGYGYDHSYCHVFTNDPE